MFAKNVIQGQRSQNEFIGQTVSVTIKIVQTKIVEQLIIYWNYSYTIFSKIYHIWEKSIRKLATAVCSIKCTRLHVFFRISGFIGLLILSLHPPESMWIVVAAIHHLFRRWFWYLLLMKVQRLNTTGLNHWWMLNKISPVFCSCNFNYFAVAKNVKEFFWCRRK